MKPRRRAVACVRVVSAYSRRATPSLESHAIGAGAWRAIVAVELLFGASSSAFGGGGCARVAGGVRWGRATSRRRARLRVLPGFLDVQPCRQVPNALPADWRVPPGVVS